jgi:transcriptional regulator with XRE-family HTH domain
MTTPVKGVEAERENIGAHVRRARLSAGLTQQQLAKQIGISQPYLSFLENGERRFNAEVLEKIGRALGLRLSSLLAQDERDVWQEGFDAGVRAAQRALERLPSQLQDQATNREDGCP